VGARRFHPNRGWGLGGEFSSLGGKRWSGVSPLAFGRAARSAPADATDSGEVLETKSALQITGRFDFAPLGGSCFCCVLGCFH
jgi:hypothetical protein